MGISNESQYEIGHSGFKARAATDLKPYLIVQPSCGSPLVCFDVRISSKRGDRFFLPLIEEKPAGIMILKHAVKKS